MIKKQLIHKVRKTLSAVNSSPAKTSTPDQTLRSPSQKQERSFVPGPLTTQEAAKKNADRFARVKEMREAAKGG